MRRIKNNFSFLCASSSVDRDSNNLSIFNIIEEISVGRENIVQVKVGETFEDAIDIPLELVMTWEQVSNIDVPLSSEVKTKILCPNGDEKDYISFPFSFERGKKKLRLRLQTRGLPFAGYGAYIFKIYLNDDKKYILASEIPLDVKQKTIG
jgi:hypothetical protein